MSEQFGLGPPATLAVMPPTIDNPILNSPFREPGRHFRFDDDGITTEVAEGRRLSTYFVPIPAPKKKGGAQLSLGMQGDWTAERMKANDFINDIRRYVAAWRQSNYPGITAVTRELLALLAERRARAPRVLLPGRGARDRHLPRRGRRPQPALDRGAPARGERGQERGPVPHRVQDGDRLGQDRGHGDAHRLAGAQQARQPPGQALQRHVPRGHAGHHDPRPAAGAAAQRPRQLLRRARPRHARPAAPAPAGDDPDHELPRLHRAGDDRGLHDHQEAARRPRRRPRPLQGDARRRSSGASAAASAPRRTSSSSTTRPTTATSRRPPTEKEKLTADERAEANRAKEEARVWLNGLRAVKAKLGIRAIYDLSATPFFLKGSGYPEGTLFPWVVSDFALIDAIESGVVKIPRVPVADDTMATDGPVYRDLWPRIRDDLPRKGRANEDLGGDPQAARGARGRAPPALRQLREGAHRPGRTPAQGTPPVFIVVCQNTSISKLVLRLDRRLRAALLDSGDDRSSCRATCRSSATWRRAPTRRRTAGSTARTRCSSTRRSSSRARRWTRRSRRSPRSRSRSSSASYLAREPHRSEDEITDEDLLREVMNTVGKKDRLGEQVRCVVSVSMLTEGWDANTVTHILGVRALRDAAPVRAGRRPRPAARELRRGRGRHVRAGVRRGLRRPVQLHPDHGRPGPWSRRRSTGSARCPSERPRADLPARPGLPLRPADRAPERQRSPRTR